MFAVDDEPASVDVLPHNAAFATWKTRLGELGGSIQAYLAAVETLRESTLALASPGHDSPFVDALYHEIDANLSKIKSMEAQMCIGRTALQSMRNQSRVLAPINRLPVEILSRIFSMSIEEEKDSVKCRSPGQTNFVDTPPQVCRYWRDVAFHTSSLWTHITLHESMPHHRTRAELSLKRSKRLPLHISVEFMSEGDAPWLNDVVDLLLPHISRCVSLKIVVNGVVQLEHLLRALMGHRPPLQMKSITWTNKLPTDSPLLYDGSYDAMQGAEHLSLTGVAFGWGDLTCAGLLSLTISDFVTACHSSWGPPDHFEDLLRGCPMLEYLELGGHGLGHEYVDGWEGMGHAAESSIFLGHLRTLKLTCVQSYVVHHIAFVLAAPNLDTVTLTEVGPLTRTAGFEEDACNAFNALQAILLSFKTSLLSLSLRAINIPHFGRGDEDLESLPRLENLTISLVEMEWDDHDDLLYELLSNQFCPNLRCLTIMDCPTLLFSSEHIDLLTKRRFNMGNPIQRLAVRHCGDLQGRQPELLVQLRERVTEFEYVA
ncbi:hypothetical protein BOTBODRAFT_58385 [Botryobasidium botryosum FD-172 SS1]|uniref:F-box domain-containing protein n=1 Tax=Botryobasidium botryosum (strain FD-172 SS1) TaxID=930990 RepID=A0A067M395_BOTB1|nr:hypothetical protein BOTBODRAFT_58385 [Botryobasidium botryosum FD-172 SS1]